jgi:hypothetical protein
MPDEGSFSPEQQNEFLFMQLVMMFQGAAYQHMGKVMNPVTQKVERDMPQAKGAVDMLGMLEEKTRGNLSDNEMRMLEHVLYEVRMNYVDEVNKDTEVEAKGETEAPEESPDTPETEGVTQESEESDSATDETEPPQEGESP